jgi:hypothetical protein
MSAHGFSNLISLDYCPATVRTSFDALCQIMRAAVSDRRITFDPCQVVPLPIKRQEEQRLEHWPNPSIVDFVLSSCWQRTVATDSASSQGCSDRAWICSEDESLWPTTRVTSRQEDEIHHRHPRS